MICEKCKAEIKNCNYNKHYNSCIGKKPYKKLTNCPHCDLDLSTIEKTANRGNHVNWCEKNPARKKSNNTETNKYKKKKFLLSKEERSRRVSEAMKKCHASGKHPGWSFVNKDKNRRSYPEIVLFDFLFKEGLFETNTIVEKFPYKRYFLDFAFINLKLDLEIDGHQHYSTEEAINHDKVRNETLINDGWKVYRINWKTFCSNKVVEFEKFVSYLKNIKNETSVFYSLDEIKPKKNSAKELYFKKNENFKNCLEDFKINIKEFGWIKKMKKIGIKSPYTFLKNFHPELINLIYKSKFTNSQFGTCWVMNEVESKKIKKEELESYLKLGWVKGRKISARNRS